MSATTSNKFTHHPLLWIAVCFAGGILFADSFSIDWKTYFFIILIFFVLTILFLGKSFAHVFILLGFVAVGGFYFQSEKQNKPTNSVKNLYDEKQINSGDPVEIEGVVQGKPELSVGGFSLNLQTAKIFYKGKEFKTSGNVRLYANVPNEKIQTEYNALDLHYGAKIRVAINLVREEKYLNAGGISFTEIQAQKDIEAIAVIKSPLLIERLEDKPIYSPFAWIYDYRQNLIETFSRNFNVETSGVLIASLLGNQNYLTKNTSENFREGGTFHVLVISGLHITFIGGIFLLIIRRLTSKRFWQFVITCTALWLYSIAVGAEIPVVRAALMFTILLFSFVIYRQGTLLNSLGFCALIILLWRPQDLFSQSFHLTYVSLFAIIAFAFPLIEKLRSIGSWMPSAENPFPPNVPKRLKALSETLYWNEKLWQKTLNENIWNCRLFKTDFGNRLNERGLQKPLRWIFEGISVTTIVQIFLLPFTIFYFHRLSWSAVLLNMWVGFFIALESFAAIIAVFLLPFSRIIALPFIKLSEFFNWLLMALPNVLIEQNWASVRVPIYAGEMKAIYVLYFLPLILLTIILNFWKPFSLEKQKKGFFTSKKILFFYLLTFLFFAFLIIFHPFSSPTPDGKLTLDFLDVGQGDSILVTFPNGETMLVDGGGRFNLAEFYVEQEDDEKEAFEPDAQGVGETVVSEFLWEKGYSKVDYILATHADADHLQGLVDVAKNFKIRTALIGRDNSTEKDFEGFSAMLARKNIPTKKLSRGDSFEISGVKVFVLNPKTEISGNSANNDSLVLRLVFGNREFLLTGDMEKETEFEMLNNSLNVEADIVKVPHHGSRTSSIQEFIEATKAEYAIIPVGRKSRFGHPHQEIVERWKDAGAKVLTTGERGTITISTDGKNLEIQTFIK